jgi:hypothetical protein
MNMENFKSRVAGSAWTVLNIGNGRSLVVSPTRRILNHCEERMGCVRLFWPLDAYVHDVRALGEDSVEVSAYKKRSTLNAKN